MTLPKKWIPVLSFLTLTFIIWISKKLCVSFPIQPDEKATRAIVDHTPKLEIQPQPQLQYDGQLDLRPVAAALFQAGTLKPVGQPYTKMVIIPQTKHDDVSWVSENFGGSETIHTSIYRVDNSSAGLHSPKNKGHEVMVYLSYIVNNYDNLSDVNIFMHAHRFSWHNDDLLENDSVQMIARLSAERVQREGFMNLRCTYAAPAPRNDAC
jgi:hypothetical protein